jgi:hypothetical protein
MSSIILLNENVPLFEEQFGQLDYDWLLKVTEARDCREVAPCVRRWVNGKNLSLNPSYRAHDFYMGLLQVDGDTRTMKKWFASRARYHYVMGEVKMARFFFARGTLNWKTVLYFFTSYSTVLRKIIIRKFKVFG